MRKQVNREMCRRNKDERKSRFSRRMLVRKSGAVNTVWNQRLSPRRAVHNKAKRVSIFRIIYQQKRKQEDRTVNKRERSTVTGSTFESESFCLTLEILHQWPLFSWMLRIRLHVAKREKRASHRGVGAYQKHSHIPISWFRDKRQRRIASPGS